jgi:hypothetical protein
VQALNDLAEYTGIAYQEGTADGVHFFIQQGLYRYFRTDTRGVAHGDGYDWFLIHRLLKIDILFFL